MKHQIKITERDIYKFVFSPESLDAEKKIYLETNQDRFKDKVEYCRELKNSSQEKTSEELLTKVVNKILSPNIIELIPQTLPAEIKDSRLRLAAQSLNLAKKNYIYSFSDSVNNYILKIIKTDSQTLLYFFSSDSIKKAKVSFFPSGTIYNIEDISKPTEIIDEPNIEKVTLEKL